MHVRRSGTIIGNVLMSALKSWKSGWLLATLLFAASSHASAAEIEPNNSCGNPQVLGSMTDAVDITGTLESQDVDFYEFTATAGDEFYLSFSAPQDGSAALERSDAYMVLLDENCQTLSVIYTDADFPVFDYNLPDTGNFLIAITGAGDTGLDGEHDKTGGYTLHASVGQIDVVYGTVTVPGGAAYEGSGTIMLELCDTISVGYCTSYGEQSVTPGAERYRFDASTANQSTYRLRFTPSAAETNYLATTSETFTGAKGTDVHQNITLTTTGLSLTDLKLCGTGKQVPGSKCKITFTLTNPGSETLTVDTWLLVTASNGNGEVATAKFESGNAKRKPVTVALDPNAPTPVTLSVLLPEAMPDGASASIQLFASATSNPYHTYVNTTVGGFSVQAEQGLVLFDNAELAQRQQRAAHARQAAMDRTRNSLVHSPR